MSGQGEKKKNTLDAITRRLLGGDPRGRGNMAELNRLLSSASVLPLPDQDVGEVSGQAADRREPDRFVAMKRQAETARLKDMEGLKDGVAAADQTLGREQAKARKTSDRTGRLNIYTCESCRRHIVTRDEEHGVTPFMVACRAAENCRGMMKSSMYRVFDQSMRPDYVWRKPTADEFGDLSPGARDHVERGGLLLYPINEPGCDHGN